MRRGRFRVRVDRRSTARFPHRLDRRRLLAGPPSLRGGRVERDAEQPRVKGRVAAERLQLLKRLHEGVLGGVTGVVRRAEHTEEGVAEAILVTNHQFAESLRAACQTLSNELFV